MALRQYFTLGEAARLGRFRSGTMVDYLARNGIVRPSVRPNPGRGRNRLYSFADAVLLRALNRLLERGIPVARLGRVQAAYAKLMQGIEPGRLPARFLMTDGERAFFRDDPAALIELSGKDGLAFALVLDMQPILEEVTSEAEKLAA